MTKCSFKLSHFKEVFKRAKKLGYVFTTFRDYEKVAASNRLIILRHDIDFRVDRAYEIAKIEKDLGIRSTFFVRLHAKEYNPFEYISYTILRQIKDWGFEIGLHFEALDIGHITGEDVVNLFKREKTILEEILKVKVVSAVQHGDFSGVSRNKENHFFNNYTKEDVGILNHPFEDRFFKKMKYISDSFGSWREGCMCQHIGKFDSLQINIHPIYWFHKFYHLG